MKTGFGTSRGQPSKLDYTGLRVHAKAARCRFLAHRVNSWQCSISVAFGAKRT